MKWYRGLDGKPRLWFETDEIEQIMEDELRKAGLMPTAGKAIVDVERFIERHLKADLDQYADLDPDVLGATLFDPTRAPQVNINRALTAACDEVAPETGQLGRWRATMAHEGSHIVLHRVLFEVEEVQVAPFSWEAALPSSGSKVMRCLNREVSFGGGKDWREVQANRGMAALLMPSRLFAHLSREEFAKLRIGTVPPDAGAPEADKLAERLAARCAVSRQAAAIRLETIGFTNPAGQPQLPLA